MENMLIRLNEFGPNKEEYKTLKTSILLYEREFYKERKMIIDVVENHIFPLP